MPVNSTRRLFIYFAAYQFTVGLFEAWDEGFEPSYLDANDLSMTMLSVSQGVAFLPWALKAGPSMLSDKFPNRRRIFCAFGLLVSGICFLILTLFSPANTFFPLYVTIMCIRNVAIALADGATEGLSVDAQIDEISGSLQSWMMVGRMSGMMFGSVVGGYLAAISYQTCMIFLGFSMMAFMPINLFIKEERQAVSASGKYLAVGVEADSVVNISSADVDSADIVKGSGDPQTMDSSPDPVDESDVEKLLAKQPVAAKIADAGEKAPEISELQVLWGQIKERPIMCFILYTFVTNLGTFIASFPIVVWLQEVHDFTIEEIGWLTLMGAFGNMIVSVPTGYFFDWVKNKRITLYFAALLAGGTYFTFLIAQGKVALFLAQLVIAGGTGALYTVQCSMIRVVADERIGASMFGVVLGAMNLAAFIGTFAAGPISDNIDMDKCYLVGGIFSILGCVFVPFIETNETYHVPEQLAATIESNRRTTDAAAKYTDELDAPLMDSLDVTDDNVDSIILTSQHPTIARYAKFFGIRADTARAMIDKPKQIFDSIFSRKKTSTTFTSSQYTPLESAFTNSKDESIEIVTSTL
jgi:MFS family permease